MLRTPLSRHSRPSARRRSVGRAGWSFSVALAAVLVAGCGSKSGPFVWADNYPVQRANEYVIGEGDLISVNVYGNERLSTRSRVRSDGRIALPLLRDVDVAGKAPSVVASEIEKKLKDADLVIDPHVTIVVEEVRPISVTLLGRFSRPGTYSLGPNAGMAEALAAGGGLSEFAHKDRIFVLRRTPTPVRIRFTLESITSMTGRAPLFRLQAGDVIEVQ